MTLLIPRSGHPPFLRGDFDDDNERVRVFDPAEGCPLPWPTKPYPDLEGFVAQYKARQKVEELRSAEERLARLERNTAAAKAEIALLKGSDTKGTP